MAVRIHRQLNADYWTDRLAVIEEDLEASNFSEHRSAEADAVALLKYVVWIKRKWAEAARRTSARREGSQWT